MDRETSQTMDRGLAVLERLAEPDAAAGRTVTQLAQDLGVGRPVVYRLVASLARLDLVIRRDDGRIALGTGLIRLAAAVLPSVREAALPVLRELADHTGCTAHLTVADRGDALAVAVVEPRHTDLHVAYRMGARHPLSEGAAGRAILAGREGGTGVVRTEGELQAGAHGLAAPVAGAEASVGVVSLEAVQTERVEPYVLAAANRLAGLIG
ncbi:helix-turn-helix domain-containing protein [Calidifontibacter sp. DB0510]|uniref:Helix-turn-helix domain-containing protein n=1 Tax=Metallococcus carri TaxID=1656884 RepID=A0A967AZ68_9MICO|nr:helix-turn-helix domain-containing protein [Metallococcus carri]NHN54515.1 helix-turn-helix domain-containing protein [Metallococcus carri]NOP36646.1 helix-turn-helix domain-containing protein [Calidifontibacter sp. DB2511S]